MTFSFQNPVTCGTLNQYLFYAKEGTTEYKKYYPAQQP